MAFLEINNLHKRFGAVDVLKGIDLQIEEGGFLVLVGPSGCGKSTLLNTIAGLETISAGEIRINGRAVNDLHPSQRDIAMVFQSYALYPNMSVAQNIAFGMEMRGVPKPERDKAVADVAKTLQISHLLDRKPSQLSGGQRQRVAMGRALVRNPQVFLFDEPLSNLDAKLRVDMRTEIKRLHQSMKTTIVYVTHDQIEAMTLATKIAVLRDGLLQQFGTPHEIYNNPANLFVAGFIGSPAMNLLSLPCVDGNVQLGEQRHPLPPRHRDQTRVWLGVRPEHITDRVEEGHLRLPATVLQRELMGADYLLHVSTPIGTLRFSRRHRGTVPEKGESLPIGFSPADVHLFHAETQHNLLMECNHV